MLWVRPGGGLTRVSFMVELWDGRGTPLWTEDRNSVFIWEGVKAECLIPSNETREDSMVTRGSSLSAVPPRPVHLTSDWAFQLVTGPLGFSRAESFCRSQFSSLVRLDQLEDQEELFSVLQQAGLHPPLWVRSPSKAASTPVGPSRQCE